MTKKVLLLAVTIVFSLFYGEITMAQGDAELLETESCLDCHDGHDEELSVPYDSALALSIHQDMECVDCHTSITELPHDEDLKSVNCGDCHEDDADIYVKHGRLSVEFGEDIPSCSDCHGHHYILPSTEKQSKVNPLQLPETCGKCHEDIDLTKKHEILYGKAVEVYTSSVHGKATLGGVYVAATCNDCHSTGGTAHRILGPGDAESSINHFNIPKSKVHHYQN